MTSKIYRSTSKGSNARIQILNISRGLMTINSIFRNLISSGGSYVLYGNPYRGNANVDQGYMEPKTILSFTMKPPERDATPPERDAKPPERDAKPPERDAKSPDHYGGGSLMVIIPGL
jgi:hypothetical protein|tara:strand:- start:922 stop:1275 length:354 start_codon:yes stop_codon:yes gene_type:complete